MKIFLNAGASPNFMKIAPIARAFDQQKQLTYKIVHTGWHYDANMSDVFLKSLVSDSPTIIWVQVAGPMPDKRQKS
jgi:UDP-N-acetylglucosamine 2-epimerase (non-hydrolysing)